MNIHTQIIIACIFQATLLITIISLAYKLYCTKRELKLTRMDINKGISQDKPIRSQVNAKMTSQNTCVTSDGIERTILITKDYLNKTKYCFIRYFKELVIREIHGYSKDGLLVILSEVDKVNFRLHFTDEIYVADVKANMVGWIVEDDDFEVNVVDIEVTKEVIKG